MYTTTLRGLFNIKEASQITNYIIRKGFAGTVDGVDVDQQCITLSHTKRISKVAGKTIEGFIDGLQTED